MNNQSEELIPSYLSKQKACFIWPYFGPQYIHRFIACKNHLQRLVDLYCIALSPKTTTYSFWGESYDDVTYCVDGPWELESPRDLFRQVYFKLCEINPDIIFTHSYSSIDARSAAVYALRNNKRLCIMTDSHYADYPRKWFVEFVKSLIINGADALLLSGPIHSHYYTKNLGFSFPVFYGYNAINMSSLQKMCQDASKDSTRLDPLLKIPYLFCAARPLTKKNIPALCNAWAQTRAAESRNLLIAGCLQSDYGIPSCHKSIVFLGSLSQGQVQYIIKHSSGCILPSISEQFGNFVLEAIAFKKPILVSNRLGCLHAAMNYEKTYIFDPLRIDSIAEQIDAWLFDSFSNDSLSLELAEHGPLATDVRDFANSAYNIIFSYQRRSQPRRLLSLLLFLALNMIYRNKLFVDINHD